jgi:signal transduction histidine kinase
MVVVSPQAFAVGEYGRCNYGRGQYGRCNENTTVTTPSGLKVSVNLSDGQVLPRSGYDVVITPLNGSGSSFSQAEIYIDGVRVAIVMPGENGTAKWHWDTVRYPGKDIQIIVTDKDGRTVTMNFAIRIATASTDNPATTDSTANATKDEVTRSAFGIPILGDVITKVGDSVVRFVKVLPQPVVRSFPYLLFALLLVEIVILLLQTQRELRELRIMQALAKRERTMMEAKKTFTQLVSHYLRTPLTILQGGSEILAADKAAATIVPALQKIIADLRVQIEDIISKISDGATPASTVSDEVERIKMKRYVAVWLPVVLIGVVTAIFVYLANTVTDYDTGVVEIFLQVAIYSLLIVAVVYTFRRLHLHRRDAVTARRILESEISLQSQRDTVIQQAAQNLHAKQVELGQLLAGLPADSKNADFVRKGANQLQAVLDKFLIASQLQGSRSTEPYSEAALGDIFAQARPAADAAAQQKHLEVTLKGDMPLQVQNVKLLALVMRHLLANAAAFSNENGSVEVAGEPMKTGYAVRVIDHGVGVDPEKLSQIFQPFYRPDGAEDFSHEGMGFSLYLDKLIMAHLGGELDIASAVGKGTTVTFGWPAAGK